jgi:hypothetical protein
MPNVRNQRRGATTSAKIAPRLFPVRWSDLCTPGMGVNLWGVSALYVNPVNVKSSWTLTKVLAEGKGEIVRDRPKGKIRGHHTSYYSSSAFRLFLELKSSLAYSPAA